MLLSLSNNCHGIDAIILDLLHDHETTIVVFKSSVFVAIVRSK
jgi:hypothetical protein